MDYVGLKSTARKLLANFGQLMTLTQNTSATYSPDTGTNTVTSTSTTDYGVILPYENISVADSLIQQNDQQVFIQLSVVPKPTDTITINAIIYNIISVKAIEPAAINVLYELQVRK
jgi:hypothetical protein